jgi:hypothetical protein
MVYRYYFTLILVSLREDKNKKKKGKREPKAIYNSK